ncbi:MAG: hypothetical protein IJX99_08105 [Clostridia bacterium]|nr:hypothetical protein [Clostridia bacterium]
MLIVDYTNTIILVSVVMFFAIMNIIGFVKKKAWFVMTSVLFNITMFILHVLLKDSLTKDALMFNAMTDFICLAINIPLLLVVDEIETRRELIRNVFENKYKK